MPFELDKTVAKMRCDVCGKITKNPVVIKTCCVDKPVDVVVTRSGKLDG